MHVAPWCLTTSLSSSMVIIYNMLSGDYALVEGDFLEKVLCDEVSPDDSDLRMLIDGGFVVSDFSSSPPRGVREFSVFVSVTSRCNLRCVYCYESFRSGVDMSLDVASKVLDWLSSVLSGGGYERLVFVHYGGEPLLNPGVITYLGREVRKLCSRLGVECVECLVTNGTLLSGFSSTAREFIDFVQVTIDGVGLVHDVRRPYVDGRGSFCDVISGLLSALDHGLRVCIRVNVDRGNVDRVPELLHYLRDLGVYRKINYIGFSPVYPPQATSTYSQALSLDEWCTHFLKLLRCAVDLGFRIQPPPAGGGCTFGSGAAIDERGSVYPCPGFLGIEAMCLGRISGYWCLPRVEVKACEDCRFKWICEGGCRYLAYVTGRGLNERYCLKPYYERVLEEHVRLFVKSVEGSEGGSC